MCGLLDTGDWNFDELRDACVPWATLLADCLSSGTYAYLSASPVAVVQPGLLRTSQGDQQVLG